MTSEDAAVVAVLREQNWSRVGLAREVVRLRAERDRLRVALEKIVTVGNALIATKPATMTEKFMALDIVDRTARAALASGEESREPASAGPAEEPDDEKEKL